MHTPVKLHDDIPGGRLPDLRQWAGFYLSTVNHTDISDRLEEQGLSRHHYVEKVYFTPTEDYLIVVCQGTRTSMQVGPLLPDGFDSRLKHQDQSDEQQQQQ